MLNILYNRCNVIVSNFCRLYLITVSMEATKTNFPKFFFFWLIWESGSNRTRVYRSSRSLSWFNLVSAVGLSSFDESRDKNRQCKREKSNSSLAVLANVADRLELLVFFNKKASGKWRKVLFNEPTVLQMIPSSRKQLLKSLCICMFRSNYQTQYFAIMLFYAQCY